MPSQNYPLPNISDGGIALFKTLNTYTGYKGWPIVLITTFIVILLSNFSRSRDFSGALSSSSGLCFLLGFFLYLMGLVPEVWPAVFAVVSIVSLLGKIKTGG